MCLARFSLLIVVLVSFAPPAAAQTTARVQHTIEVRDPTSRIFYVTSRYTGLAQPSLDLALPVWTPGWYTIENYARNVLRLASIADASTSTWLNYGSSQAFGVSYYAGGEVIATMLDLAILHASGGSARLDDLMRALWRESAVKGRGFSPTSRRRSRRPLHET